MSNQSRSSSSRLANNEQPQVGGGMERRKSSKHNGPPTPWKRKPLLQEADDEVDAAASPQQQRKVKKIKLRLSEGPTSRPSSRDGGGSLMKPVQGEGEGSSIPKGDSKKESDLVSQPLSATSGNVKLEEGSSSPPAGPPITTTPTFAPTILTRIKAQPRNANERAMMPDIETLETMLQLGSYRSNSSIHATDPPPRPPPLSTSTSHHTTNERQDAPAQSSPPLWSRKAEELSQVTSLCPSPNKSKSKAKLDPVMVKSSRSGIARGLLLTRRPRVGQEVVRKIGRDDGRWAFDLVVKGRKGSAAKNADGPLVKEQEASDDTNGLASSSKFELQGLPSAPPTVAQLVSQDPSSLVLYRAWQHRTSLYLFLSRPCVCNSGTECACSEQGGLSMLPCKLPEEVGAVAVGWARVVGAQLVVDEDEAAGAGATKVRWSMQMAVDETSWWLPSTRGKGAASAAWTSTRPSQHHITLPHTPSQRSSSTTFPFNIKTRTLLTSLPCPLCNLSLPRHHWSYYLCSNCSTRIEAYVPSLAGGDVDFGTASIPTEGPRMDNGRAVWDNGRVGRGLRVVQEHEGATFKCAEYSWSARPGATAAASVPGPSASTSATATPSSAPSLIHLLSSGSWTRLCKSSLSWLLAPSMPYERRTNQSSVFELEVALCSRSKRSKRKAHEPLLLELTSLGDVNLAHRLVELVEEVEQRVGVAAAAASASRPHRGPRVATRAHLTVLGCDGVKHRLDLPQTGGVTYLHLGAPAVLSVATLDGVAGSGHKVKTMLNAMVVSGDVVWVPGIEKDGGVTVTIEAKALCVGVMLVE